MNNVLDNVDVTRLLSVDPGLRSVVTARGRAVKKLVLKRNRASC